MNEQHQRWHASAVAEVVQAFESNVTGLTTAEATRRLDRFGSNRLTAAAPALAIRILAAQFRSIVVLLLLGATALSLVLGDVVEAVAIGVVIALNAAMGFVIELRARRAMEALRNLAAARASVVRDGQLRIVGADALVPGDVIELVAGQCVPAYGRLLSGTDLRIDEAALIGESVPVSKIADTMFDATAPLADRLNMVYQGTSVVAGIGRAIVTATGDGTEVGRIGRLARSVTEERLRSSGSSTSSVAVSSGFRSGSRSWSPRSGLREVSRGVVWSRPRSRSRSRLCPRASRR